MTAPPCRTLASATRWCICGAVGLEAGADVEGHVGGIAEEALHDGVIAAQGDEVMSSHTNIFVIQAVSMLPLLLIHLMHTSNDRNIIEFKK
jgi:hypothetical protein